MNTKVERTVGKVGAIAILALALTAALKPAPAHAFFFEAIGAGLNLAVGLAASNPNPPSEAQVAERAKHQSLAEAVFGLDKETGATSVAEALRDPKLARAVEAKIAQ